MTWRVYETFVGDKIVGSSIPNPWMTWGITWAEAENPLLFDDCYALKFNRQTLVWTAEFYSQNIKPRWREVPRLLPEFLALIGEEQQAAALASAINFNRERNSQ